MNPGLGVSKTVPKTTSLWTGKGHDGLEPPPNPDLEMKLVAWLDSQHVGGIMNEAVEDKRALHDQISAAVELTKEKKYDRGIGDLRAVPAPALQPRRARQAGAEQVVLLLRCLRGGDQPALRRSGQVLQHLAQEPVHGPGPPHQSGSDLPRAKRPRKRHRAVPRRPANPAQEPPDSPHPHRHRPPQGPRAAVPGARQPDQRLARPTPRRQRKGRLQPAPLDETEYHSDPPCQLVGRRVCYAL